MREIKFRGLDIKGSWRTGYYTFWQMTHQIWESKEKSGLQEATGYKIIPESLGQYTGLKDKNGKEIYEGDIVKYVDNPTNHYSGNYEVVIDAGFIGINAGFDLNLHELECHKWIEIIGNIHEKPELIKE